MNDQDYLEEVHASDSISDFSLPVEVNYPTECIENAEKIDIQELKENYPDVADYIERMDERLGGGGPDCIMNTLECYRTEDGSLIVCSNNNQYSNSFMVVKGNDVYCKAGCIETNRPMNEFINEKELMPNMTYHIDGHFNYQTDELGRVSSSYEKLSGVDELERSGKRCSLQGIVTSKDGLPDDVGGHIVANNVHGPTEAINIFPQNCDLNNSGEWKQMENYIQ